MPRTRRLDLPAVTQHVVQRGNDRQACFFRAADYLRYLQELREAALKYECRVHAYVLMTNHVHLLVTPTTIGAISSMMQSVGRRYVRYVNDAIGRTGTLWEGRYKSSLVDSERYVLACYRYIELNPVRAGMVTDPAEYRWSSYHANGLGLHDPLVRSHALYQQIAKNDFERWKIGVRVHFLTIRDGCFRSWLLLVAVVIGQAPAGFFSPRMERWICQGQGAWIFRQ